MQEAPISASRTRTARCGGPGRPESSTSQSAGWVRGLPQDQVDHRIWALSPGVTSSDRPSTAEQQASGIRSSGPPILPACPSDSTTASLTLTTCPAGPNVRLEDPARAGERDRRPDRPERTRRHIVSPSPVIRRGVVPMPELLAAGRGSGVIGRRVPVPGAVALASTAPGPRPRR